jgi:hypothetical protein
VGPVSLLNKIDFKKGMVTQYDHFMKDDLKNKKKHASTGIH